MTRDTSGFNGWMDNHETGTDPHVPGAVPHVLHAEQGMLERHSAPLCAGSIFKAGVQTALVKYLLSSLKTKLNHQINDLFKDYGRVLQDRNGLRSPFLS